MLGVGDSGGRCCRCRRPGETLMKGVQAGAQIVAKAGWARSRASDEVSDQSSAGGSGGLKVRGPSAAWVGMGGGPRARQSAGTQQESDE